MSIYKRGGVWWADFVVGGKRTRVTTGTSDKKAATEYHDKLKSEAWRKSKLGERPQHTWEEACVRWLREAQDKRDYDGDCEKI